MEELGRILVADDEQVFLSSTADLLRREGYYCDCVSDGPSAAAKLKESRYDLLVADIKMPGNPELELIKEVKEKNYGLQVILVTGYPSMGSAIESIGLPVVADLVKPVDFDELISQVNAAVERSKVYRALENTQNHLQEWHEKLDQMRVVLKDNPADVGLVPIESFVTVTLHNIVLSLASLKNVTEALARLTDDHDVCHLLNCPRMNTLLDALKETVAALKKTKSSFKSKELGELRQRLETILEEQT
jgi:DNA-binding response OmpR family regulator